MANPNSEHLQHCLDRLRGGDRAAGRELLEHTCDRLSQLAHVMLKGYARLRRWEETADVVQNALVRLCRALETVTPTTLRDYYRLAALQIRRELLDLVRHYYGPQGAGGHHQSNADGSPSGDAAPPAYERCDATQDPSRLAAWADFHRQAAALPEDEREVFDLLWYQGLGHTEAAAVLGVAARTVKRRWQSACLKLHDALQGVLPAQ